MQRQAACLQPGAIERKRGPRQLLHAQDLGVEAALTRFRWLDILESIVESVQRLSRLEPLPGVYLYLE